MLVDSFSREINYLRISLTKNCNFRCLYCMPKIPLYKKSDENLLSFDELFLFVKICIDEGVKKIRLTGGEPLLRENLHEFVRMITNYAPDIDIALTTNAYLLESCAQGLKQAGLKRINVSLDSLKPERIKKISNVDALGQILKGIDAGLKAGFKMKLNCVALKDFNDDELNALLEFSKEKNIQIRFIEFMENAHAYGALKGLGREQILKILSKSYDIKALERSKNSPVSLFSANDYTFGTIDPHSDAFCDTCNRLRLTAEGFLVPCLYFDEAMSMRKALKNRDLKTALALLKEVVKNKPEKNKWSVKDNQSSTRAFYQTGG